jgi:hypothetical protein
LEDFTNSPCSLHPFFANGTGLESGSAGYRNLYHTSATTEVDSTSMSDLPQTKTIKSSKAQLYPPTLPIYSYKDYSPKATTVYTQHEQEANDLVEMLRGYVSVFRDLPMKSYILYGQTPGLRYGMASYVPPRSN